MHPLSTKEWPHWGFWRLSAPWPIKCVALQLRQLAFYKTYNISISHSPAEHGFLPTDPTNGITIVRNIFEDIRISCGAWNDNPQSRTVPLVVGWVVTPAVRMLLDSFITAPIQNCSVWMIMSQPQAKLFGIRSALSKSVNFHLCAKNYFLALTCINTVERGTVFAGYGCQSKRRANNSASVFDFCYRHQ